MSDSAPSVASSLTQFFDQIHRSGSPREAAECARIRILDTVAVGIAGSTRPPVKRIRAAIAPGVSVKQSTAEGEAAGVSMIWGTGQYGSPGQAALINAAATHAEDFDDTHTVAVVHGSACVVPAAWAAAEAAGATWGRLLDAVVVGWEVAARIGQASGGAFHRRGLHPTSVAGIFGAAAAVAFVRQYDDDRLLNAFGLCGSAVSGLNAYLQNGSDGKLLNPGFASRAAIEACDLAESGVTGPHAVLEGRHGVFEAFGDLPESVTRAFATLGEVWEIERVSIKPYPACHFTHSVIDCVLELGGKGVTTDNLDHLDCAVPRQTFDLIAKPWTSKLNPASNYEVRFSLPWLAAIALVDGDVTRETFHDELPNRADISEVAKRVVIHEWTGSGYPYAFPGEVTATLRDGTTMTVRREINRGHPDDPLSTAQLLHKIQMCTPSESGTDADVADALLGADAQALIRTLSARISAVKTARTN